MTGFGVVVRRGFLLAAVVVLLTQSTPTAMGAQSEPQIYEFELTYQRAECGGIFRGELHVAGTRVQVLFDGPGGMSPAGSGPVGADGSFNVAPADAQHFTLSGQIADPAVTGSGVFETALTSGNCTFRLTGQRRGARPEAVPPDAATERPDEVFDPTSTEPLSDGEIVWLLRQRETDESEIDSAIREADASFERERAFGIEERAPAARYQALLRSLGARRNPDGTPAFAQLVAFSQPGGPMDLLATVRGERVVSAFNRLVRLCINEGL